MCVCVLVCAANGSLNLTGCGGIFKNYMGFIFVSFALLRLSQWLLSLPLIFPKTVMDLHPIKEIAYPSHQSVASEIGVHCCIFQWWMCINGLGRKLEVIYLAIPFT